MPGRAAAWRSRSSQPGDPMTEKGPNPPPLCVADDATFWPWLSSPAFGSWPDPGETVVIPPHRWDGGLGPRPSARFRGDRAHACPSGRVQACRGGQEAAGRAAAQVHLRRRSLVCIRGRPAHGPRAHRRGGRVCRRIGIPENSPPQLEPVERGTLRRGGAGPAGLAGDSDVPGAPERPGARPAPRPKRQPPQGADAPHAPLRQRARERGAGALSRAAVVGGRARGRAWRPGELARRGAHPGARDTLRRGRATRGAHLGYPRPRALERQASPRYDLFPRTETAIFPR